MLESEYQARLIQTLRDRFPGCIILKNDSSYLQGIPDLSIFWEDRWAMLEVKPYERAVERPNQRTYVRILNSMSFAAFISPETEGEVLDDLEQALRPRRAARVSRRV